MTAQCRSNDESVHAVATEAVRHLATQCSDPSAIESLAKHFFSVVSGLCRIFVVVIDLTILCLCHRQVLTKAVHHVLLCFLAAFVLSFVRTDFVTAVSHK